MALIGMLLAGGGSVVLPGCGSEEPLPVCEQAERQATRAPRITMGTFEKVNGSLLRVRFTVPEEGFDTQCQAPLTVTVIATAFRNPENVPAGGVPSEEPRSAQITLAGETEAYEPGDYFVDAECPAGFDSTPSFALHVIDAQGNEYTTPPQAIE